MEDRT